MAVVESIHSPKHLSYLILCLLFLGFRNTLPENFGIIFDDEMDTNHLVCIYLKLQPRLFWLVLSMRSTNTHRMSG